MIGFLIAILVLVGIRAAIFANGIDEKQKADFLAKKKEKACPPHDWSYNHEDRLQCTRCNLKAGDISTNGGEY